MRSKPWLRGTEAGAKCRWRLRATRTAPWWSASAIRVSGCHRRRRHASSKPSSRPRNEGSASASLSAGRSSRRTAEVSGHERTASTEPWSRSSSPLRLRVDEEIVMKEDHPGGRLFEVERSAYHAERPGFRIAELQISPRQQAAVALPHERPGHVLCPPSVNTTLSHSPDVTWPVEASCSPCLSRLYLLCPEARRANAVQRSTHRRPQGTFRWKWSPGASAQSRSKWTRIAPRPQHRAHQAGWFVDGGRSASSTGHGARLPRGSNCCCAGGRSPPWGVEAGGIEPRGARTRGRDRPRADRCSGVASAVVKRPGPYTGETRCPPPPQTTC